METVVQKSHTISQTKTSDKILFWKNLEFNRFGVIAFVLAIVACTSGITAGLFVDGNNFIQNILVAAPTMFTLCMILAVAPLRWVIGAGIFALVVDVLLMMF